MFQKMMNLAEVVHGEQKYGNSGLEYMYHINQVVNYVRGMLLMRNPDLDHNKVLQVAAGHDIIEDTRITAEDFLDWGFEPDVVASLYAISKQPGESREEYLKRCCLDPMAKFVKEGDSEVNLFNSMMGNVSRRIKKYTSNLEYIRSLENV